MISMIVATGKDRVIGKDNQMPWHLPADLAYFKKSQVAIPLSWAEKRLNQLDEHCLTAGISC